VFDSSIAKLGLRIRPGHDVEVVNILDDARFRDYWTAYYELAKRKGISKAQAQEETRTRSTLVGTLLVRLGAADAMLCGTSGLFSDHLRYVRSVTGLAPGAHTLGVMQMLILQDRRVFICDTHVNADPNAIQLAELTLLAARDVARLGVAPTVAMVSHSSYGTSEAPSAEKMRIALNLVRQTEPELDIDGEMRADSALSRSIRATDCPDSTLTTDANLLIMPNMDAANITYNALRVTAGGNVTVGGILLGAAAPVHVLTPSSTVRRIVNMTAVAVADAQAQEG
jgi:malate dehydrogenase (oxaloacetate-decarboxylating)(NADP+)